MVRVNRLYYKRICKPSTAHGVKVWSTSETSLGLDAPKPCVWQHAQESRTPLICNHGPLDSGSTMGLASLAMVSVMEVRLATIGLLCLRQVQPFCSVTVPDPHPPFSTTPLSSAARSQICQDNTCRAGAVEPKFAEAERIFLRVGSPCACPVL